MSIPTDKSGARKPAARRRVSTIVVFTVAATTLFVAVANASALTQTSQPKTAAGYGACATAGGVLRLSLPNGQCPSGSTPVTLDSRGPIGLPGKTGAAGQTGKTGSTGKTGAVGQIGPRGVNGPAGPVGKNGATGTDGRTVLSGTGAPGFLPAQSGDFYLDTVTDQLYGPADHSCGPVLCITLWRKHVSLIGLTGATGSQGPQGVQGPQGPQGSTGGQAISVIKVSTGTTLLTPTTATLMSFPVSSGRSYLIQATGVLDRVGLSDGTCQLVYASTKDQDTLDSVTVGGFYAAQDLESVALSAVLKPGSGGSVRLTCQSPDANTRIDRATTTALVVPDH